MNLKIEYVQIDSIKPYKRNAKLHPKEQVEQIKRSIIDRWETFTGKKAQLIAEG